MQPETRYARLVATGSPTRCSARAHRIGDDHRQLRPRRHGLGGPGNHPVPPCPGSFSRLIQFDRRGTGASDPLPLDSLPPWESYAQDLTAVLDEVGAEQAALLAQLDASPMALFFARTRPERTRALVLATATAKFLVADDYPIGAPAEVADAFLAPARPILGTEAMAAMFAPSRAGDARFCRWLARFQRTIASPRAVQSFLRASFEMDARPILPLIQAPTLVLHRRDYQFIPISHGGIWPSASLGPG